MSLDNEVAKLRILKGEHRSQHYRLEDDLLKRFPEQMTSVTARISGIEKDIAKYAIAKEKCVEVITIDGAASVTAKFLGMTIKDVTYTEKEPAAKALLEACKGVKGRNTDVPVGEYMGFKLSLQYESFDQQISLLLRGAMTYKIELGTDSLGNITRINNALDKLPERLAGAKDTLANIEKQMAAAKEELAKPFSQEEELAAKEARLALLNADLNIDGDGGMDVMNDTENRTADDFTEFVGAALDEMGVEYSRDYDPEQEQDEQEDNDREEQDESPRRESSFPSTGTRQPYDYGEPRTGTYGKARPSILTDLETTAKSIKPPIQGGGKSAEIDI